VNNEVIKNEERDEIGEMLRGLKRVEAPANFDFGLKAKIANSRPAAKNGGVSRFALYAVPAVLVLMVGAVLVLNSLYFAGERNVADIAPVTETKSTEQPQTPPEERPGQTIAVVDSDAAGARPTIKTRPKTTENKPRKVSNDPPGGSYDAARRLQEPIYPIGLNPNNGSEIGVKDLFGFLGIDAAFDGKKWTDTQIFGFIFTLYLAGLDTVTSNLGMHIHHLATHADDQETMRTNSYMGNVVAIEELMRAFAIVSISRFCVKETELAGVKMMPGDAVICSTPLAARDPEAYDDPNTVKLDRRVNHLTLGHSDHRCLGRHLARRELQIAHDEFIKSIPSFKIEPGFKVPFFLSSMMHIEELPLTWS